MIQAGIQPSSSTYSLVIRILCKRDVEVQKVLAMLKRQNARAGSRTTPNTSNMTELKSEGNLTRALVIFNAAVSDGLIRFFEVELYNQLLRVLSHYGNTQDSLQVYEQLNVNTTPTSATFAALINLFGRVGDLDTAFVYFEKYKELKEPVSPHDASYVYNALVDANLKCKNLEGALKVVTQDMFQADVQITTIPYNSIIRYYCIHYMMEEAKALIDNMKKTSPMPDASSFGPILSTFCQHDNFEESTKIYESLVQTDVSKSYGNMANYALLCIKNKSTKAIDVIADMRTANLEPDPILAERVVSYFATQPNQIREALRALGTVLASMKSRSLSKAITGIKAAAVKMATQATHGNFKDTLEVARLLAPICYQGLPLALAKILIENYEFDADHEAISETDYTILYDAAITISLEPSNKRASSLPPFQVLVFSLYDEIHTKSLSVTHATRSRVLTHLRRADTALVAKWESLFESSSEPQDAPQSKTETLSTSVMKAAVDNQASTALDILRTQIIDADMMPSPEPLRDAIAFIGKQGQLDIALAMYTACIDAYKSSNWDVARMERAIYMVSNSILISYAQQGDMVHAKRYYQQIKALNRYPDGNGYASLLLGSAKCATDEATDALIIYDEAKRHDVKPTTFFYNVVISKLAKARKLESAMRLFEEMQSFDIMPNSITYGAIISASVRAGSETLACKLFNDMIASSQPPRVGPFNNMIQFYVRQQPDREKALSYFAELRRCRIKPSAHTYKLLMEAYCSIAPYDMPTAYRMLSEMELRDRVHPSATHYATLIYSYGILQRDVRSADRVFEEMSKKHVAKDEVVYQAILDTLISNDQMERAEELYATMRTEIARSACPYIENVFIRGYGQRGHLEKARHMFDAMSDDKINHSNEVIREPSTFEAMVRAYADNDQFGQAKQVFELMVQREFPEKVTAVVAELVSNA
jgi:pentatricopeptide repeat protein